MVVLVGAVLAIGLCWLAAQRDGSGRAPARAGRRRQADGVTRPSIYEAAGGMPAFEALAAAHHARCVVDPVLEHPFSHTTNPDHVHNLAAYWAEVLGEPAR